MILGILIMQLLYPMWCFWLEEKPEQTLSPLACEVFSLQLIFLKEM